MRALGGVVLAAWLVAACSGSTNQNRTTGSDGRGGGAGSSDDAGGSHAGGGGNSSNTAGGGSTGNAPGAGDSGDAGAAGSAGAATIQGMPGAHHPDCDGDCGGSPVGSWLYTGKTSCNLIPYSADPPPTEECSILLAPNSVPGEPPIKLQRSPRFDYSDQPLDAAILVIRQDGSYMFTSVYKGTAHLHLAAQCRRLGENTVACSDVKAAVEPALLGEGTGSNLACVDDAEGGCDCSYEMNLALGPPGVWRTTPDGKLLFQPSDFFSGMEVPSPEPATYCAGETLALGPELRIPGQPATGEPTVFERIDCTDGVKGIGEDGVDCGLACSPCPESGAL